MLYIKAGEQKAGDAQWNAYQVDACVELVSPKCASGDFNVVFDHDKLTEMFVVEFDIWPSEKADYVPYKEPFGLIDRIALPYFKEFVNVSLYLFQKLFSAVELEKTVGPARRWYVIFAAHVLPKEISGMRL